ncbi:AMIN-like domain-containing (lipo)protein [Agromyces bauzanensis]
MVEDGFPQRLSSLVGLEIRTGSHPPCFERVVIEFAGSGDLPGYRVEYRADPIIDSPRGEPVEVAGDATLVISAGAWMPNPEGDGYDGPRELVPVNVETILELKQIENFEGMTAWAIGLDRERPFTVETLENPSRLVVDISLE